MPPRSEMEYDRCRPERHQQVELGGENDDPDAPERLLNCTPRVPGPSHARPQAAVRHLWAVDLETPHLDLRTLHTLIWTLRPVRLLRSTGETGGSGVRGGLRPPRFSRDHHSPPPPCESGRFAVASVGPPRAGRIVGAGNSACGVVAPAAAGGTSLLDSGRRAGGSLAPLPADAVPRVAGCFGSSLLAHTARTTKYPALFLPACLLPSSFA
uniref:Uncharacterized protein n=1 Tax=Arundo donax TaxID=35708 RepID=A0A0A9F5X5_ARUDO